jgi:hypothetical protein
MFITINIITSAGNSVHLKLGVEAVIADSLRSLFVGVIAGEGHGPRVAQAAVQDHHLHERVHHFGRGRALEGPRDFVPANNLRPTQTRARLLAQLSNYMCTTYSLDIY